MALHRQNKQAHRHLALTSHLNGATIVVADLKTVIVDSAMDTIAIG
jgi:hypothetical protein